MKRFALVWCSEHLASPFQQMFLDTFRQPGEQWDILSPADPAFDTRAAGYDGYILSGSEKSVVDDAQTPFVARLLEWLHRTAETSSSPVLGICFGAQALATALGGQVGRNPDGSFRLGVEQLAWDATADRQRWPELGADAVLVASHGECVLALPPDATALASSRTIAHEIFLVGNRFLGIQGHPEMSIRDLQEGFMPLHRAEFSPERWRGVEQECELTLKREGVVALSQRLLAQGRL